MSLMCDFCAAIERREVFINDVAHDSQLVLYIALIQGKL